MSFFGLGSADLSTPIGVVVKAATNNLLIGPDWTKNLEICDMITRTEGGAEQAMKAILRRMNDSDQNTCYLAMIIAETCMKNCGPKFALCVNKNFMNQMVVIAKGGKGVKNSDEALRIIQGWARAFESRRSSFPLFFDTYMGMKSRGVRFPPEPENAPSINFGDSQSGGAPDGWEPYSDQPSHGAGSSGARSSTGGGRNSRSSAAGAGARSAVTSEFAAAAAAGSLGSWDYVPSSSDEMERIDADLAIVMEKVKMCRQMLFISPGVDKDEVLADVVGFLEACRDRMVDLIESGTRGMLNEGLFEKCLKVNDAVLRTLDAERTGKPIDPDDDGSTAQLKREAGGEDAEGNSKESEADASAGTLLDLGDESPKHSKAVPAATSAQSYSLLSAAENDFFGKTPAQPAAAGATRSAAYQQQHQQQKHQQQKAAAVDPFAANGPTPDPFGNQFGSAPVPAPAPAAAVQTAAVMPPPAPAPAPAATTTTASASVSAAGEGNNPFNDVLGAAPPPGVPPPGHNATGAASSNTADTDELDFFLSGGSATGAAAQPGAAQGQGQGQGSTGDADFDAFLDSLDQPAGK